MTRQRLGFTLIEITVVLGIIGILIAIIIPRLQDGRLNQRLRQQSLELMDNIRFAQNMTLIGRSVTTCVKDDGTDPLYDAECQTEGSVCATAGYTCRAVTPRGGYGVFFPNAEADRDTYVLFGDLGDETRTGQTLYPYVYDGTSADTQVESVKQLNDGVEIRNVRVDEVFSAPPGVSCKTDLISPSSRFLASDVVESSAVSVTWSQPKATLLTQFNTFKAVNDACPDQRVRIQVWQKLTNNCRIITIEGTSGLVDEQPDPQCSTL